jgi:hypothetical protein
VPLFCNTVQHTNIAYKQRVSITFKYDLDGNKMLDKEITHKVVNGFTNRRIILHLFQVGSPTRATFLDCIVLALKRSHRAA